VKASPFYRQARLMIRSLPHVAAEDCFALKGGTAINLFWRDMPRLSVDIDLTYVPVDTRERSLASIGQALDRIAGRLERTIAGARVQKAVASDSGRVTRLFVHDEGARIVIEPNQVIRGAVFPTEQRDLAPAAEDAFEMAVSVPTLSLADLYGGKICAALDRQHPRDLFDVKLLLDEGGIDGATRKAFVVYLASHNRPMSELLDPLRKDFTTAYENEFAGMVRDPATYDELAAARETLIESIRVGLTASEREFLLSIKAAEPRWEIMDLPGIQALPAIEWKLANIEKMNPAKRREAYERLQGILEQ
jgi:predicted nucleotidyltransferase component of viral defense system